MIELHLGPGWRKVSGDELIPGGQEQIHHLYTRNEWDSFLQTEVWVRDDAVVHGPRPVMLGDGERVHVVDAINEYLVTQDIPEEASAWWAQIKLKLLEGVE